MNDLISKLNPDQKDSVLYNDGPMMVIAGAGSGKTRVLTHKIAYLIKKGYDPENILALTFTNKAGKEMKNRIIKMIGNDAQKLWMGTFHSIFAKILRTEADKIGFNSNFTIYDSNDSESLIKNIIKEKQLDKDIYAYKEVSRRISKLKNILVTPNFYKNNPDFQNEDIRKNLARLGDIYQEYTDRCKRSNAMDFDDLLLKTNLLFSHDDSVLEKYQNKFKYILVDEYQDTNHSQYIIIKNLSKIHKKICIVGDDSQSIYSFRGADISNILNFEKDFPECKKFKLEQNYRSTKNIVSIAGNLIKYNTNQLEKEVFTENDYGPKVKVYKAVNDSYEADFIANTIYEQKAFNDFNNSDFAILYRTNNQSRSIEDSLRKKNIPYKIWGGLSFYQRAEIKDVLAYMKICINKNDDESLKRIINFPARGIGDTTLEKIQDLASYHKKSLFEILENINKINIDITTGTKNRITDFVSLINSFNIKSKNADAFSLTEMIVKETGLQRYYQKDISLDGKERLRNIEELINGINEITFNYENTYNRKITIAEFLEEVSLSTDIDKSIRDDNKVALMTIHMSKGLEFKNVFISGLEQNLFPSSMSIQDSKQIEEERRLFYVAITRTEENLFITYSGSRLRYGRRINTEPSIFLSELNNNNLEIVNSGANEIISQQNHNNENKINHRLYGNINIKTLKYSDNINNPNSSNGYGKLRNIKPVNSLKNIQENKIQLSIGNIIKHDRFGIGEILNIEGQGTERKAIIKFEQDNITRTIILAFAKIKVLN